MVLAFTFSVEARVKKEITKSFEASPGGLLNLDTDIGSVDIETSPDKTVEVEILLKAKTSDEEEAEEIFERFEVDFEQEGNDIFITGEYKNAEKSWRFWEKHEKRPQVKFTITIPEEFDVIVETSAGSISIADLKGEVRAKTSGGSLSFDNIDGPVLAKTSGGSIKLSSCSGSADVRTSGGSIRIGSVSGDVVAHTSGGSIEVDEVMGAIDASTSGGSVYARITRQPEHDCRLVTSGGSVTVYIDPDMDFDVDARTSAGYVTTDFPVTVRGKLSKSALTAEINAGGPELYLRTSGGNIDLREL
jgi:DUF4097 and DUF4098 domain-containing protein YvlB